MRGRKMWSDSWKNQRRERSGSNMSRAFSRPRVFDIEWDGKTRGKGKPNIGAPQRSPLLLVIFLIWMATILKEME